MQFTCTAKYMMLSASHHAQKKRLLFYIEDALVFDVVVALDYDHPDYVFPLDVGRFLGKNIRLECDPAVEIQFAQTDDPTLDYSGKYRPLIHFTAIRGWINDPNGLVYHEGKYLMYFQHNPVATTWENMHWGAAESTDLVHWKEKGDVLFPDRHGTIFSGSGIADTENRSGLGTEDQYPLLFFYTCAGNTSAASRGEPFTQRLAYSVDGGNSLQRYDNPLLGHIVGENRDPKVIHYEADGSYIMALYLDGHDFALFRSENLLHWQELQRITLPDDAECPDFYLLPVDGDEHNVKWVFSAASDRYLIGTFDGKQFTPETEQQRLHYGNASYAAQTWSGTPGRKIRTAFASNVIPGMPFGSCMNIPQEMRLKTINGRCKLCAEPVAELTHLYKNTFTASGALVTEQEPFCHSVASKACDVRVTVVSTGEDWTIGLFGLTVSYDAGASMLRCGECSAPVTETANGVTVRILYDTIYAEIFAEEGSVFMGMRYVQDSLLHTFTIASNRATVSSLELA